MSKLAQKDIGFTLGGLFIINAGTMVSVISAGLSLLLAIPSYISDKKL